MSNAEITINDLLLSRIAAGEESRAEWKGFREHADRDLSLWRDLAVLQHDEKRFSRIGDEAMEVASHVHAPSEQERNAIPFPAPLRAQQRTARWSGWAVAAMIALAWAATVGTPAGPRASSTAHQAGLTGFTSARDAFNAYLTKGQEEGIVLSETPQRILLETRPAPSGEGYELIYMQQILERTVVSDLYRYRPDAQDEQGRPTLVRYEQPAAKSM